MSSLITKLCVTCSTISVKSHTPLQATIPPIQLREDGSLPLDLWKTHSAKDTITIPRSDMIQHFANQLLHKADVDGSRFVIDKVKLLM